MATFRLIAATAVLGILAACSSQTVQDLGENSLACVHVEGSSLFTFFTGYAQTRIVHVPPRLQEAMGIEDLKEFTDRCWLEGNEAIMLDLLTNRE